MKLCRIRDRNKAVWRYVPKRHKTSHRGKQRHVPIGPDAQAIVLAHTTDRSDRDYVFSPQRSVPVRKAKDGVIPMEPRKPSPRVGRMFKKDAINRAVNRAGDGTVNHDPQHPSLAYFLADAGVEAP